MLSRYEKMSNLPTHNFSCLKYLIVGLGNPEVSYTYTRHNIGFRMVDALAEKIGTDFAKSRYGWTAKSKYRGRQLLLLKSSTYMNLSGNAVRYYLKKERLEITGLLVLVDDVSLPFGRLRLRSRGSSGGHNGLHHINECLQTEAYARIRFGIGSNFPKGKQVEYVLSSFTEIEENTLLEVLKNCAEMALSFCTLGAQETMNRYH